MRPQNLAMTTALAACLVGLVLAATAAQAPGDDATRAEPKVQEPIPIELDLREAPPIKPSAVFIKRTPAVVKQFEGVMLVGRRCRLQDKKKGQPWRVITLATEPDKPKLPALRVLPSYSLEAMEDLRAENDDVEFRIDGETFAYGKDAYVLVSSFMTFRPDKSPDGKTPPATGPKATPTASTAPADVDEPGTPDELLRRIFTKKPPETMVVPVTPKDRPPSAVEADRTGPGRKRNLLISRVIRLMPRAKDGWRHVRFASDNSLREPPVRALPCRQLWLIQRHGTSRLKVSGQYTVYRGRRYLLLRRAMLQRDLGQF